MKKIVNHTFKIVGIHEISGFTAKTPETWSLLPFFCIPRSTLDVKEVHSVVKQVILEGKTMNCAVHILGRKNEQHNLDLKSRRKESMVVSRQKFLQMLSLMW